MLYTPFHAIRKRWLLVRMTVIGAVLAGLVPLNGQQPAGSATQDPSGTSEPKQNPTTSSAFSTKNNLDVEVTGQDSGSTFGLRVNLAQVHVVVRDLNSNLLAHLKQEDFQLFDQGKVQPYIAGRCDPLQASCARVPGWGYTALRSRPCARGGGFQ